MESLEQLQHWYFITTKKPESKALFDISYKNWLYSNFRFFHRPNTNGLGVLVCCGDMNSFENLRGDHLSIFMRSFVWKLDTAAPFGSDTMQPTLDLRCSIRTRRIRIEITGWREWNVNMRRIHTISIGKEGVSYQRIWYTRAWANDWYLLPYIHHLHIYYTDNVSSRMIRYLPSYIHKCISIFTNHSKFQPGGLTAIYCSAESRMYDLGLPCTLTTLPLDKMAAISQTIFSNAFSWMNRFVFWLQCHWSLFLMIHWTITIIGLVNGLAPKRQAIIRTNADPAHWRI